MERVMVFNSAVQAHLQMISLRAIRPLKLASFDVFFLEDYSLGCDWLT